MYRAVVALSNTETGVLSDTGTRLVPVVQVTLVAGPPVEIQVRMESIDIEILYYLHGYRLTKYMFSVGLYYICTSSLIYSNIDCASTRTIDSYITAIHTRLMV